MGNLDHSDGFLSDQIHHLGPQILTQGGVEVRQRLVKQHQVRAGGKAAGDGHAVLLATRQGGGQPAAPGASCPTAVKMMIRQ